MQRVIFGDNQFFGVNHMSEERARSQAMQFRDTRAILDVLDVAYEEGVRVFMCTTHDRIDEVCNHIRLNRERYVGFQFYPCMPYAHKYANAVTEYGMLEALRRFLPDHGRVSAVVKGGMSLARKDVEGLCQLLIDAEMKMFEGVETPVVFLQNIVTDLLLGLGFTDAFRFFAEHVRNRYNAEAGFITMNLPRLLDALDHVGIQNPIVCANINKIGFRMSGGEALYRKVIEQRRFRPMAMSVFASGAIPVREALEYVCRQPRIESIVFGASSRSNIRQTVQLIREFDDAMSNSPELCGVVGPSRADGG